MSRQTERKPQYRSKEEERSRFGFEYVRANINYRTEIPALPEKPRHKPDEKALDKRIGDIQAAIAATKEERRQKKEEIKAVNKSYDDRIQELKANVELGRKCIEVLYSDLDFLARELERVKGKIRSRLNKLDDNADYIRDLKAQARPPKRTNKKLEEMTVRELDAERHRIELEMSTRSLTRKEESELNAQLVKIGRIKADPTHELPKDEHPRPDTSAAVAAAEAARDELRVQLEKLRVEKGKLVAQREEVDWKIYCIREDLGEFIEEVKRVAAQEEQNEQAQALYDRSKALKQQIYDLRDQITQAEKEFDEKSQEYEYEQEKIRWIGWATKIQEEKREEWEAEKAERKRQKLREKEKEAKGETKGDTKEEGKPEQREERRRPNRNQKEIDNCSFLIDYCKRLYPSATQTQTAEKKTVNLQEQLKKGSWAKEKGVQIIQSKKARRDDEEEPTPKQSRKAEPEEDQQAGKFRHDFFVQKFFENAKIIPPSGAEELDKIIKELEDKVEYYVSHPDEGVETKFEQDRRFVDKNTKPDTGKYTKTKNARVINSEDFPSLA